MVELDLVSTLDRLKDYAEGRRKTDEFVHLIEADRLAFSSSSANNINNSGHRDDKETSTD